MSRKLAAFAAFAFAVHLFAGARPASAQNESAPIFSDESTAEDASGPTLSTPESSSNQYSRSDSASRSNQSTYNGGQTQKRVPYNTTVPHVMHPQGGDQNGQSSDQSYGPGTTSYQSRSANPGYQQTPRTGSSENSSGQGQGTWVRPGRNNSAIQGQGNDSQQSSVQQQQYRRTQSGYPQQYNDTQSGNMSANYMSSGNQRRNMQTSATSSVMSSNQSSQGMNNGYGQSNYGQPNYDSPNYRQSNNYGQSNSGYGNSGSSFWRNPFSSSPTPAQNSAYGPQYRSGGPRQAMVTPNGVFIDGVAPTESIAPGRVTVGKPQSVSVMGSQPAMNDSGEVIAPGHNMGSESMMMEGEPSMEGGPMMGGNCGGGDGFTSPYCNSCSSCGGGCGGGCMNGQCGQCGQCNDCCDEDDCGFGGEHRPYGRPWVLAPIDWLCGELNDCHRGWWWAEDLTLFAGAQNFKNIADGGVTPSFGFEQGVNWGVPIFPDLGLTAQFGYMGTESEFENAVGSRNQSFVTAGVFHRPWCDQCWDAGVVFDWLHDDFFGGGAGFDIGQVRGQIGLQWNRANEAGFWFSYGVMSSDAFQTLDQYNFFYRHQFCRGGDIRFWGGFTGNAFGMGGLFGSDFEVPLSKRFAIDGGFNYFIPSDGAANGGLREETWNIGMNLVWYLGGTAQCSTPYRPLFNVADNGSLMTVLR
jgi:hypothetical protein